MTNVSQRIASLPPEKRALLERALLKQRASSAADQAIPRRDEDGPCRMSSAQERVWFLHQMYPDNAAYNLFRVWRMEGSLDVAALKKALDTIVVRHQVLRTTFEMRGDVPVQVVGETRPVELTSSDMSGIPKAKREQKARDRMVAEARRPFDLARDLMLRGALIRLGEHEHLLAVTMHHIAFDGWSLGVLNDELAALYKSFVEGSDSAPPPPPIQYTDYAQWQRSHFKGGVLESQVSYWRRQLAGAPPVEMPTDHTRPAFPSFRGGKHHLLISRKLTDALSALSKQEGVTLFMTLLSAFQTLLYRYSGQEDVSVGSAIAGRSRTQTERLVGLFANILVLRTDLSGRPTFRELLARVRDVCLGSYAHQELPFEKLVEELEPERDLSRNPLFQVAFLFQNSPGGKLELPGLTKAPFEIDNETAKFDLTLSLGETPEGLVGSVEYSTDLFDTGTAREIAGRFEVLLESIVADPNRSILDLPLLRKDEVESILRRSSQTSRP